MRLEDGREEGQRGLSVRGLSVPERSPRLVEGYCGHCGSSFGSALEAQAQALALGQALDRRRVREGDLVRLGRGSLGQRVAAGVTSSVAFKVPYLDSQRVCGTYWARSEDLKI